MCSAISPLADDIPSVGPYMFSVRKGRKGIMCVTNNPLGPTGNKEPWIGARDEKTKSSCKDETLSWVE